MFGFLGEKLIPSISTSLSASYYFHQKNISKKRAKCLHNSIYPLIFAPRLRNDVNMVTVVQLVRASDCGSECRGFESHLPPAKKRKFERIFLFFCYCPNNPPKGGNVESM